MFKCFKRNYFISVIYMDEKFKSYHFRLFQIESLFPKKPHIILKNKIEEIANSIGVHKEDIMVTAFNRI